ncbi:Tail completion protein [uncultured Caudovirales phage]|uniref:Tail completion protein n=1 Tax=uncultured Caudovirales phage TaxID=2100421 RepID=A0A6J5SGJ6_9CAUD|nr:Tail completion protein [uncultured Caudovirales phage]CAB4199357.1 Tail completion protein [uncultured Caudovirales phage]CAB4212928.1 Tail completion protein [uncultured Caudovirales phage]CAB5227986.1 Tail completion protein [uncultured Caudovirales phage]
MSEAPVDTPEAYVIWSLQAAKDHAVMEADGIAFEEAHYLVKVVGKDPAKVRDAYRLIHTELQDADLSITGFFCMDVSRTDRVAYAEQDGDDRWIHRGGIYRVSASH